MIKKGDRYDCYEIKSASMLRTDFTKGLRNFEKTFPELAGKKRYYLFRTDITGF